MMYERKATMGSRCWKIVLALLPLSSIVYQAWLAQYFYLICAFVLH